MRTDLIADLENRREYLKIRAAFPAEKLEANRGLWIAWNPAGSRIVAQASDPESLDAQILAAGEDLEQCVVEGISATESMVGVEGLGPEG
jgi:hypothetical protein